MSSQDPLILSFSQPYPLADMATQEGKLAKASLRGERQSEGVSQLICRIKMGGPLMPAATQPEDGYSAAF